MAELDVNKLYLPTCYENCDKNQCMLRWLQSKKGEGISSLITLADLADYAQLSIATPGRASVTAYCRVKGCYSFIDISVRALVGVETCSECGGLGYFPESHNGNYCRECGLTGFKGGREALGI